MKNIEITLIFVSLFYLMNIKIIIDMNKRILLLLLPMCFTFMAMGQEAPEVQKSLVNKVTATWCPSCGTWGWTLFSDLVDDNSEKALVIATHYSGDLAIPAATEMATNFGASGQPRFMLDGSDQNATSASADTKRIEIKDAIDANYLMAPVVNSGIVANITDETLNLLTVNVKSKFFQAASGEYYIGAYIVEDGVIANQSQQGPNAVHKNVLRANIGATTFGESLASGDIAMDTEIDHQFTMQLDDSWNQENLTIATIIWEKEGSTYNFVNTNSAIITEVMTTSVGDLAPAMVEFSVQPTVSNGQSNIVLNTSERQEKIDLQVYNQLGQLQRSILQGKSLGIGETTYPLDSFESGVYYVVLRVDDKKVLTKKWIVL